MVIMLRLLICIGYFLVVFIFGIFIIMDIKISEGWLFTGYVIMMVMGMTLPIVVFNKDFTNDYNKLKEEHIKLQEEKIIVSKLHEKLILAISKLKEE